RQFAFAWVRTERNHGKFLQVRASWEGLKSNPLEFGGDVSRRDLGFVTQRHAPRQRIGTQELQVGAETAALRTNIRCLTKKVCGNADNGGSGDREAHTPILPQRKVFCHYAAAGGSGNEVG